MWKWLKKYNAFIFYVSALIVLLTAARLTADYSIFTIIGLYAGGLFSWLLLEYSIHRFVFHSDAEKRFVPKVFSASHIYHHRNPKDASDLFMELRMSVPIAAGYYLLAWLVTGDWQATAYLFFGLISGYFLYEYVHYQTHHGTCKSRPMKYMKRYHLGRHHRSADSCYGLSSPLADILFGTFKPPQTTESVSSGQPRRLPPTRKDIYKER